MIDPIIAGLGVATRFQDAGHKVKVWYPLATGTGEATEVGDGMVDKVQEWKPWMKWADLIVITDNAKYLDDFEPFFNQGYPIFGSNRAGSMLELDRIHGMKVLEDVGIETLPMEKFTSYDKAIEFVSNNPKTYVSKPIGDGDKALSFVPPDNAGLVHKLTKWKKTNRMNGEFVLQEKIEGVEMAVGGWFGPAGWGQWLCENWEEKRMLAGGYGQNTGEQGTILRYVKRSQLFDEVLAPATDYLHEIGYVGYVDMNCFISNDATPYPLEWTTRFGWPLMHIQMATHKGDPAKWMKDLLDGKDTLIADERVAAGVVYSHARYPEEGGPKEDSHGCPLVGFTPKNLKNIHWVCMKMDVAPVQVGDEVEWLDVPVSAGGYLFVTTGLGSSIKAASEAATNLARSIKMPSNPGLRIDIGDRLEDELKTLQKMGYAEGLKFS